MFCDTGADPPGAVHCFPRDGAVGPGLPEKGWIFRMKYTLEIAGLQRDLPLCKITDDLYIAA